MKADKADKEKARIRRCEKKKKRPLHEQGPEKKGVQIGIDMERKVFKILKYFKKRNRGG